MEGAALKGCLGAMRTMGMDASAKLVEDHGMIAQGRQQDDALEAQLPEQNIHLLVDGRTLHVPRFHHQVQAGLAAAGDGAGLEFAQIVPGPLAEQTDEKGSIAGEAACVEIWPVVELLDGLEDSGAGIGSDPRLIVDDPGHRLGRYLGQVRDNLEW